MKNFLKKSTAILVAGAATIGVMSMSTAAHAEGERYVFISHAPDSDSWWNVIKNAVKQAASDMNVTVEYRNPPTGDLADMARIVEQAVATNPDGIVLSIADFDTLEGPLEKASKKGIPFITMNSGTQEQSKALGALLHVGQPEFAAGFGAGERAKKQGVKSFLCVNHYITNPASVERCMGFAKGLGIELGSQMIDSGSDPTDVETKVSAYLRKNPNTEAILTLGPTSAHPTLRALEKNRNLKDIYFGTFDLSGEISAAIKDGRINFAIDQQPYLQGYLPISFLTLYTRYGLIPSNDVNSGPGFITKDNIALVEKYAGEFR
ncbi:MAG: sugar ABC transporter substrate-binding protein [Gammaproteobacteria bacterium]|jgi:simple sugar transport system substrate-binding protein|uniref:Monosaccharide ABC transporter substrate-binding protein, CUT2 family n=1 Tax=Marinomonas polaris DSM 16579 TaxID=1122206 RepID=A0A1M4TBM8_9GAMM|nr:sugar ABC transporter substrate-binding protein [Marinomonas polaris]MBU1295049.1 sugar ABC transporter substrate-binding protein [Gammaproteobacteria bacterium]MBU1465391.1 sugar ABC transporter substrate-binding protein [Gammaproteobacteria bacterium]MBU2023574.1 sugar ABC transporter substrate-binding protein [Gammaproteobacteria bacterium]MBU2236508.1 sugar ABC transporter substrate-binding protein [Gammaproteobacteria bacterium]MBU2317056.1 sugar ABC transporter substrate-binding prote